MYVQVSGIEAELVSPKAHARRHDSSVYTWRATQGRQMGITIKRSGMKEGKNKGVDEAGIKMRCAVDQQRTPCSLGRRALVGCGWLGVWLGGTKGTG